MFFFRFLEFKKLYIYIVVTATNDPTGFRFFMSRENTVFPKDFPLLEKFERCQDCPLLAGILDYLAAGRVDSWTEGDDYTLEV